MAAHLVGVAGRLVVVGKWDEPSHHAQHRKGLYLQVGGGWGAAVLVQRNEAVVFLGGDLVKAGVYARM